MIPAIRLDISWLDLLFGIFSCFWQEGHQQIQSKIESYWSSPTDSLACLSVRSGFDLVLQALSLPPGSEVLISAVTIRDIIRILEHHGLVPIPVDVDMHTLSVNHNDLVRQIGPKTKMIIVAHLYGSRMPLENIIRVARQHGLYFIEDCAQAYIGKDYRGHPDSDVSMFSFGQIKTHTALGGAMLRFKEASLLVKARTLQNRYPYQRWPFFLKRLSLFVILKLFSYPSIFEGFVRACRLFGKSHDQVISEALRGFSGSDLLTKIRQQPCSPLLRLLYRRLQQGNNKSIEERISFVHSVSAHLPMTRQPGAQANHHTHWLFPIQTPNPDQLMHLLWKAGFHATRGASSLYVFVPPNTEPTKMPTKAIEMMEQLLYLPMYPKLSERNIQRLGHMITDFEAGQDQATPKS